MVNFVHKVFTIEIKTLVILLNMTILHNHATSEIIFTTNDNTKYSHLKVF